MANEDINYADRTTVIGGMINEYLACGKDLEDEVVHLLFSANRWEAMYVSYLLLFLFIYLNELMRLFIQAEFNQLPRIR